MAGTHKLTDAKCRSAKPDPGKKKKTLADGAGLKLNVTARSKLWRFDYRFAGNERSLSLGRYPEVGLAEARDRLAQARRWLRDGLDPVQTRADTRRAEADNTLKAVAEEWLAQQTDWADSHRVKVELRLRNDAYPVIGSLELDKLTPSVILGCLRRVEARGAIDSAHRLKHTLGQIMRHGVSTGRAVSDPTRDLRGALAKRKRSSYPHIVDPVRLGEVLRAIDGYTGSFAVKCALQLLPHVFVRPGELRGARWREFDLDGASWIIPAERMKRERNGNHTVPLSHQAVLILRELHTITGSVELLFPGHRSESRPISDGTLNAALRRLDVSQLEHVAHGFRHTASTLLNEQREFDPDLIEVQLHHVGDSVRAKYNSATYMQARRKMMQSWSDYLDALKNGATVIELQRFGAH